MAARGIARAHLVGYSYSCAVALQLALTTPETVHTLSLVAPPPLTESGRRALLAAATSALDTYQAGDHARAVDQIMTVVAGDRWRTHLDQQVPGGAHQAKHDAGTFFESDLPAVLAWRFPVDRAGTINAPVLHIDGSDTGPLFADIRHGGPNRPV